MPKNQAQNQIRKRIDLQGDHKNLEKLCLDQIEIIAFTKNIKLLLQSCINLEYLTLNSCKLQTLDNFPTLPNLITLELVDNQLSGSLEKLQQSKQISFLSLSNNSIANLCDFEPLSKLKELEILIVLNNPFTEIEGYRQQLFDSLPQLNTVDRYGRDNTMLSSDDLDSYITDKYRSLQNLDGLIPANENDMEKEEKENEGMQKDPDLGFKESIESKASRQELPSKKRIRLYRRFQSSDEQSSQGELIKHFKKIKRDIQ